MQERIKEIENLTHEKDDRAELGSKFEILKTKSVKLYKEKQSLEEDNRVLCSLVTKYKKEAEELREVNSYLSS